MADSIQAGGGFGAILSAECDRRTARLLAGGGLLGLAALHAAVIAAHAAFRGTGESWVSVAGFVALELVLFVPILPVARLQVRRWLAATDRRLFRAAVHLTLALAVVGLYRGAVLSAALVVEIGEVPLRHLESWWRHVGPWQLQADLFVYAGAGALLALLPSRAAGATGSAPAPLAARRTGPGSAGKTSADGRGARWLTVTSGGSVHVLPVEEIRWIEGAGTYVRVHGAERSYLLRDTLASLADRLEPSGFVRVHRSAILNLRHLERLEPAPRGRWTARLAGGASVRVAASRTERLEAALGNTLDR